MQDVSYSQTANQNAIQWLLFKLFRDMLGLKFSARSESGFLAIKSAGFGTGFSVKCCADCRKLVIRHAVVAVVTAVAVTRTALSWFPVADSAMANC